jgi:hypothetical protein
VPRWRCSHGTVCQVGCARQHELCTGLPEKVVGDSPALVCRAVACIGMRPAADSNTVEKNCGQKWDRLHGMAAYCASMVALMVCIWMSICVLVCLGVAVCST